MFLFSLLLLCGGIVLGDVTITTPQELIDFAINVNSESGYSNITAYLDSDLEFTPDLSSSFVPIGGEMNSFSGTFDGKGHIIKNLIINDSASLYVGLFGCSTEATIKNIVMDSSCSVVSSYSDDFFVNVGGIVGYFETCNIENTVNMASATFTGNVRYLYLGGITGRFDTGTVRNCVNYGSITHSGTSYANIGGISGICSYQYTNIENCANYGTLSHRSRLSDQYMGGILGNSFQGTVSIDNCLSVGKIVKSASTTNYAGSIVGYIATATTIITHCMWTSDVGYDVVYGYTESSSSVTTTDNSLIELNTITMNELNIYALKNDNWDKWFMLHLNEGKINNISQETLIVTQKYFPDPMKEENAFLFWCTEDTDECTEEYDPETTDIISITDLYAVWDKYTVTFDFKNGTEPKIRIISYGDTIEYPENATREGYTFNGWDNNITTMPARNLIITALWIDKNCTEFVEIVFGNKDLSQEEIQVFIRKHTDKDFTIEKVETNGETGETRAIIRFAGKEIAGSFVEIIKGSSGIFAEQVIKSISFITDFTLSSASLLFPVPLVYNIFF